MSSAKENSIRKKSRCQIQNCPKNPLASVHVLPTKNMYMRKKWIEKLQLVPTVRDPFFVCSEHFNQSDYLKVKSRKLLHKRAVPSVNLPSIKSINATSTGKIKSMIEVASPVADKRVLVSPVDEERLSESSIQEVSDSNDDHDDHDVPFEQIWLHSPLEQQLIKNTKITYEKKLISKKVIMPLPACTPVAIGYRHNKIFEKPKKYEDKNLQTNLAYDEAIKPWTLLDALHSDSDLQSWTGIPTFDALDNIVKCVASTESALDQLRKIKASPKLLTVFVMAKVKTNLTFKQMACLFNLRPKTLSHYYEKYIPILKNVSEPGLYWPTEKCKTH